MWFNTPFGKSESYQKSSNVISERDRFALKSRRSLRTTEWLPPRGPAMGRWRHDRAASGRNRPVQIRERSAFSHEASGRCGNGRDGLGAVDRGALHGRPLSGAERSSPITHLT